MLNRRQFLVQLTRLAALPGLTSVLARQSIGQTNQTSEREAVLEPVIKMLDETTFKLNQLAAELRRAGWRSPDEVDSNQLLDLEQQTFEALEAAVVVLDGIEWDNVLAVVTGKDRYGQHIEWFILQGKDSREALQLEIDTIGKTRPHEAARLQRILDARRAA